ncbi:dNA polymerase III subunit gamma/tau [Bacteroides sp. CAG:1060]|nr:dNA polymerase III subunit gamma/tau [Bacteroides sp. CAG:1060]
MRNLKDIASKENITIDSESLHIIAGKADGAMRDALTIFDQMVAFCGTDIRYEDVMHNLNVLDYEYCFRLVDGFLAGDYASALLILDEILSKGFNSQYFISALGSHLRDLLVSRTGGLESLIDMPESLAARYSEQASRCSVKFLYDALAIASQCEAGYRMALNQRLHIEFALMKMAFLVRQPQSAPVAEKPEPVRPSKPVQQLKPEPETEQPKPEPVAVKPESEAEQPKPAPKMEPEPARSAASTRRTPKSGAALSMSALISDEQGKADDTEDIQNSPGTVELPSDEVMESGWKKLSESYSDKPRLSNALSNAKLEFSQEDGHKVVSFSVTNEAQRKWIEDKMLRELEVKMCELVSCKALRLRPFVIPEEELPDKKYMPKDKAEDLVRNNAEVRSLVTDLQLDVK